MSRVRLARAFVLTLLASACGHETLDLLPPADDEVGGSTGGAPTGGGGATSGMAGNGSATGGWGGRDAGPTPVPDCPRTQPNCVPCPTNRYCPPGLSCDVFRNYCAPYCSQGFACVERDLPACDTARNVCVECTVQGHCGIGFICEFEKCVPEPNPECFSNEHCDNPAEPVCFNGFCRPCRSNMECEPGHCEYGRCEPGPGGM